MRPVGSSSWSAQVSAAPIVHSLMGAHSLVADGGSKRMVSVPHSRRRMTLSSIAHSFAAMSVFVEHPVMVAPDHGCQLGRAGRWRGRCDATHATQLPRIPG
jgi:hypothetical protein